MSNHIHVPDHHVCPVATTPVAVIDVVVEEVAVECPSPEPQVPAPPLATTHEHPPDEHYEAPSLEPVVIRPPKTYSPIDVLFLARNRLAFTRESLEVLIDNTDWSMVSALYLYDDQSEDGTCEYLESMAPCMPVKTVFKSGTFNAPMWALIDCVAGDSEGMICKVDNDALMPPGWLPIGMGVMRRHADLDLLGLGYWHGKSGDYQASEVNYEPARFIGGIGIFSKRMLYDVEMQYPESTNFRGIMQDNMKVGWAYPYVPVVLLDRVPFEPWKSLSKQYQDCGYQRDCGYYSKRDYNLYGWWLSQRGYSV